MIKLIDINKSFGPQKIFDGASLSINRRERLGLVGRNGHGKTTLFRIILDLEEVDAGEVQKAKNYRIGYLTQSLDFSQNTILAEGCLGLPKSQAAESWRVEKVLAGLGFKPDEFLRPPGTFSGGYQVRLNLAKVLVSEPDLLLLDEPTNFLDVVAIRWLAAYLIQWPGELCLITHDRAFMDRVVTHVAAIYQHRIRKLEGSTEKLYENIERDEEIYEKTRRNEEKKRKQTQMYIERFRTKARLASNVQSKIKALERQEKKEKLEVVKNLRFSFGYIANPAKILMSVNRLCFAYAPEKRIIQNFNLSVGQRDRICVIGHNGQGKTTLLRLLAGDLKPDTGEINLHNKTVLGYFEQTNIVNLNPEWTIEEEFLNMGCEKQRARGIAGAMMFEGEAAEKKTQVLSGGEKSRVLLGKILAKDSNLLLLDEPTNHLDMQSSDAFLDAIDEFEGAVIMVTHNELFLQKLANRFVIFQEDRIEYFEGSYDEFLEKVGWAQEAKNDLLSVQSSQATLEKNNKSISKKEMRRLRAEISANASRQLKPLRDRINELEQKIITAEDRIEQYNREMISLASSADGLRMGQLAKELQETKQYIEKWFVQLEEVTADHDLKARAYEKEMNRLEDGGSSADVT